jgi:two-component system, NarL family, nitrate/nitrite response regulator NarL
MKAEISAARVSVLSPRELEVASLVARGLSNKQFARSLGITESTVKIHLNSIFRKLGATNRYKLILSIHSGEKSEQSN